MNESYTYSQCSLDHSILLRKCVSIHTYIYTYPDHAHIPNSYSIQETLSSTGTRNTSLAVYQTCDCVHYCDGAKSDECSAFEPLVRYPKTLTLKSMFDVAHINFHHDEHAISSKQDHKTPGELPLWKSLSSCYILPSNTLTTTAQFPCPFLTHKSYEHGRRRPAARLATLYASASMSCLLWQAP
jgi:hypothetical protein